MYNILSLCSLHYQCMMMEWHVLGNYPLKKTHTLVFIKIITFITCKTGYFSSAGMFIPFGAPFPQALDLLSAVHSPNPYLCTICASALLVSPQTYVTVRLAVFHSGPV